MATRAPTIRSVRFLAYLAAVILANAAGLTLFFRADLTAGKVYSLSEASRRAVATLSEPLTVKVFFTRDLPAPYNGIERYLQDLLEEYALAGNRYFNYAFYPISGPEDETSRRNQEAARSYGLYPVQIQALQQDEFKVQNAYMGVVLIHGDLIETLPAVTSTDRLEYRITSAIRKMNNKISALLRLHDKIRVRLFLSSSLNVVGPYLNLSGLPDLPKKVEKIVADLNDRSYGKLAFVHLDPSLDSEAASAAERHGILALQWKQFTDPRGRTIDAGKGYIGLVVSHGDQAREVPLLHVYRLPLFGTQYQLADTDEIQAAVNQAAESVIQINQEIGYVTGHGSPPLEPMPGSREEARSLANFRKLLAENYSIRQVDLAGDGIPEGIACLIIAGPTEAFSDFELYRLDQFLMRGEAWLCSWTPFTSLPLRPAAFRDSAVLLWP